MRSSIRCSRMHSRSMRRSSCRVRRRLVTSIRSCRSSSRVRSRSCNLCGVCVRMMSRRRCSRSISNMCSRCSLCCRRSISRISRRIGCISISRIRGGVCRRYIRSSRCRAICVRRFSVRSIVSSVHRMMSSYRIRVILLLLLCIFIVVVFLVFVCLIVV